jgi:hypothetical protein
VDELTRAVADGGDLDDGVESGATDDSQLDPFGDFERGRASFSLGNVLLAMTVASIVIAVITGAVARRRESEDEFDQTWWVPAGRAPADAEPGTEHDHVAAADARPGRAPSRTQVGPLPTRREPRDRAAVGARSRPVPQDATRRGASGQPRLDVGGLSNSVAGGNRTASRNRAVRSARVEDQLKPEPPPTDKKRQPLDRRWLTRLPVKNGDP